MPPEQRREQLVDAALSVIIEQGYGGVSIEAIARTAGVTRPVVYDHFPNLGSLLHALIEREERYSLEQLARVVPDDPGDGDPVEVLAGSVRRFLDAVTARPDTWRIILLPIDGTPAIVREHVETHRALILERIEQLVRWAVKRRRASRRARRRAGRTCDPRPRRAGRTDGADRPRAVLARSLRAVRPDRDEASLALVSRT